MARPTEHYGIMLEKYRDVDEDEILSNLTQEELQQLEGEIDREVLNKIPEDVMEEDEYVYTSSSDHYSSESEEEEVNTRRAHPSLAQTKQTNRSMEKQGSLDTSHDPRRRSSKNSHQFKIPQLRKAKSREALKRQKSEEGGEMKKELLQAVKQRTKRRTCRANSSGISRRYSRKNSSNLSRRKNSKLAKEEKKSSPVNLNFVTQEMLSLRPQLKKVKTREPAKVNDMLHGVSLGHITSGVKDRQNTKEEEEEEKNDQQEEDTTQSDAEVEEEAVEDSDPPADEDVAKLNDNVHRRLNARSLANKRIRNEETMSSTTAGSTSAESYDVIGELSINPNSVEEMILRVKEDDENLTEVNLNNIQNVEMEVFEELASAMEGNTHVRHLCLANVGLTDKGARALASMLKRNSSLEKLNVESNFITGDAALRLVVALRRNNTLTELRIDNQRHIFGAKVEHEFSKILKDNKTLLRFGYQFANPGPRMAANNTLTRNMDDVRKKRMVEQRKRAQVNHNNRPQLRRQPSSEWYRRQKADRIQQLKDKGGLLDLRSAVDADVQKVLSQMDPSQYALLEQWFVARLMGQESLPNQTPENHNKGNERVQEPLRPQPPPRKLTPKPTTPRNQTPNRQPSPRDNLLQSIRSQSRTELKSPKQSQPCDTPVYSDVDSNPPSICVQEVEDRPFSPVPPVLSEDDSSSERGQKLDVSMDGTSSSNDDILSWKEGEDYDSDEYEVIEVEVTESEDESDDITCRSDDVVAAKNRESDVFSRIGSHYRQSDVYSDRSLASDVSDDAIDSRSSTTSSSGHRRHENNVMKEDAIKSLDRLQISPLVGTPEEQSSPRVRRSKKISCSPTSSSSSISSTHSVSSPSPRAVREDDSWMLNRPYYKLGAK